jgi:hypothetical protein
MDAVLKARAGATSPEERAYIDDVLAKLRSA